MARALAFGLLVLICSRSSFFHFRAARAFQTLESHAMTVNQSLRPKDAALLLGLAISTLWRMAKERADFPRPRRLSARCTVFDRDELLVWRDAQMSKEGK